ncbi:hypothetical protein Acr_13g0003650 [Actinidia rufa]|uniref:Uncharacterized protein n=1 Tax=Actinidia rufa TaxID=165716 RepID=A0A7J0FJT5_9ERIC|nr:hypothetical protein Acr_13g0003650 [Actinidia rufa]
MLSQLSASLSHCSPLATALHLRPPPPPFLFSAATNSLRNFQFSPSNFQKSRSIPFPLCDVVSKSSGISMDSPMITAASSVDSVADKLKKQSLVDEKVKSNLEDLTWDHSFVRELPGDPRNDNFPREVDLASYLSWALFPFTIRVVIR